MRVALQKPRQFWGLLARSVTTGCKICKVKPLVLYIYSESIQSEATEICDHPWLQQGGKPIHPVENTLARQANLGAMAECAPKFSG